MSDQVLQAGRSYRALSEVLYAALRDDPFYAALEAAATGDPREAMLSYFDVSCLEAERYGHLTAWRGEVTGAALWARPGLPSRAVEEKTAFLQQAIGSEALSLYKSVAASMGALSAPYVMATDWYLSILGLDPRHRGKGLGSGLVTPVLEQAGRAGVATFLETFTPGNMPFYERLGYVEVARLQEPVLGCPYRVMRRAAPSP